MINKRIVDSSIEKLKIKLFTLLYCTTINAINNINENHFYVTSTFEELCNLIKVNENGEYYIDVEIFIKQSNVLQKVR